MQTTVSEHFQVDKTAGQDGFTSEFYKRLVSNDWGRTYLGVPMTLMTQINLPSPREEGS